jgi:hypothetical protein
VSASGRLSGLPGEQGIRVERLDREAGRRRPIHDHEMGKRRALAGGVREPVRELRVGHRDLRRRILEVEVQEVGRGQRVDEDRHETGPDRPEQGRRVGRRVVEKEEHAVTAAEPEGEEPRPEAGRVPAELGIGPAAGRPRDGRMPAPASREVVEQDRACIVALRHGKADLPRALRVARDAVSDIGHAATSRRAAAS